MEKEIKYTEGIQISQETKGTNTKHNIMGFLLRSDIITTLCPMCFGNAINGCRRCFGSGFQIIDKSKNCTYAIIKT